MAPRVVAAGPRRPMSTKAPPTCPRCGVPLSRDDRPLGACPNCGAPTAPERRPPHSATVVGFVVWFMLALLLLCLMLWLVGGGA